MCHDWTAFNYSCYKFFDHPAQLDIADTICRKYSGNVTSISSMEENEFVSELAGQDIWLGLRIDSRNQTANDTWWSDRRPVTYRNWSGSDPNHQHSGELGILRVGGAQTGRWEHVFYNASFPYVCKKGRRKRTVFQYLLCLTWFVV